MLALRDLNREFLANKFPGVVKKSGGKRNSSASKGSHRFSQATAGQSVSCLCQRWSAPEGCDCWASSRSGGGASSAWLLAPGNGGPPSAGPTPPCCLSTCLSRTKGGPQTHTEKIDVTNGALKTILDEWIIWFLLIHEKFIHSMYPRYPRWCWLSYPAWQCRWVYSYVAQISCVATMWPRRAYSTSHHHPPHPPQTSAICREQRKRFSSIFCW